jgi:hypothetical protein
LADGAAWERLGSERLLETPYFALRSDRLRLPGGAIKDPYYVVERPDAAIIFPLTREVKWCSYASTAHRSGGWNSACLPG